MANNQDALRRYRVIHSILKRGGKHKTKDIVKACNDVCIKASIRTIQKDLEDLAEDNKLGFFLPIKKDPFTKTYYYSEIPDNIFPSLELEPEEINALLFYAKTISQYKEYPLFKEISNAVKKVIDGSNINPKTKELFEKEALIETEKHLPINGIEMIIEILEAISQRKVVELKYKKFNDKTFKNYKIKPILLKEDKQMWYILGVNAEKDRLNTFALDRVHSLIIKDEEFDQIEFNSEEYFKYSFGVTVSDGEPMEVVISFDPNSGNYLRTLPIHNTQEIIEDSEKRFVIKVKVIPSYEFYSKIYSYCCDATILQPPQIKYQFSKSFEKALANYNSEK